MKKIIPVFVAASLLMTAASFDSSQDDPWKVPEKYEKMKNPVVADDASLKAGKELYSDHCVSCHGKKGKGDGYKSENINTTPTDFTTATFQKQSDGALLYKFSYGHRDMPAFKKRIPDNADVIEGTFGKTRSPGDLINYLRTFGKK